MGKVTILFKRLTEDAEPPVKAHDGDAGWDVCAVGKKDFRTGLGPLHCVAYRTGLAFAVPKGYWLDVRARSSVYKYGTWLSNGVGTLDSGYRGELFGMFYCYDTVADAYKIGDRIAQLIVQPALTTDVEFVEVDELPESWDGRGEGGYGSTGR